MKIFIITLAIVTLFACNAKNSSDKRAASISVVSLSPEKEEAANNQYTGFLSDSTISEQRNITDKKKEQQQQQSPTQPVVKPDWDKKIIKTANLNLEVKSYDNFYKGIREKVSQLGGYVAQEQQTETDYKLENTLVIKVPVDQFDNALNQVTTGVEKINEKRITSEDVTGEVVDTKSRIEAKRQVRFKYLELLKQAKNMEEILNVQSEINGIQEEIESASGRVNYLTHSAAYSTINLTFYEVLNATAKDNDKPSFATRISNAFGSGWSWVGEIFVGIISIWPLLLLIFGAFIFWKRKRPVKTKAA